jgi:hypothetical protein
MCECEDVKIKGLNSHILTFTHFHIFILTSKKIRQVIAELADKSFNSIAFWTLI